MQVLSGRRAHLIRISKPLFRQQHGGFLQLIQRPPKGLGELLKAIHRRGRVHIALHQGEEPAHQAPPLHGQLPTHQVQRLNGIRPLVNLRDAGITHILLNAILFDVAVPTKRLQRRIGVVKPFVGEKRFDHRRHERHEVFRLFANRGVGVAMFEVNPNAHPVCQRPHPFIERFDAQQSLAHIGMHQNGIRRSRRILHPRKRAPL